MRKITAAAAKALEFNANSVGCMAQKSEKIRQHLKDVTQRSHMAFEQSGASVHEGGYIREIVLGFNDGLVSNFALVMGVAGALQNVSMIVLAGLAGMIAGAISMGLGVYISTKSQIEFYKSEIERERNEVYNMTENELVELREMYAAKGFKGKLLDEIVKTIGKDKEVLLKIMLQEELHLPEESFRSSVKAGLLTTVAFVVGALIPILPLLVLPKEYGFLLYSAAISALGLFVAGVLRTKVTRRNWLKSGIEMLVIGLLASTATYLAGKAFGIAVLG